MCALFNILVVDDDVSNITALERALRDQYNVLSATNGEDAVSMMESYDIALIMADDHMPGMAGVELLQKALEKHPTTIRVILTSYTDEKLLMEAVREGSVHSYIVEPWEPGEIRDTVGKWIGIHKALKELMRRIAYLEEQAELKEQQIRERERQIAELRREFSELRAQKPDRVSPESQPEERPEEGPRPQVGEILMEMGYLTKTQLDWSLKNQRMEELRHLHDMKHRLLGRILLEYRIITEEQLEEALAEQRRRLLRRGERDN